MLSAYEDVSNIISRILKHPKVLINMGKLCEVRMIFNNLYEHSLGFDCLNICDIKAMIQARNKELKTHYIERVEVFRKEIIISGKTVEENLAIMNDKKILEKIPWKGNIKEKKQLRNGFTSQLGCVS